MNRHQAGTRRTQGRQPPHTKAATGELAVCKRDLAVCKRDLAVGNRDLAVENRDLARPPATVASVTHSWPTARALYGGFGHPLT